MAPFYPAGEALWFTVSAADRKVGLSVKYVTQ